MTINEMITDNQTGFIELIISSVTLIVVTVGLLGLKFQRKEIRFYTVQKCIDDHRKILRQQQHLRIKKECSEDHLISVRDHLGLITEELFYIREGYLPKNLTMSWVRHMIEFIPLIYDQKTVKFLVQFVIKQNRKNKKSF